MRGFYNVLTCLIFNFHRLTPLQRILLRWMLKPVTDTHRDAAITTGYGYRGDLSCNCWI